MMYKFEHDWFSQNIPNLEKIFKGYQNQSGPNILEIGALEGRSTVWFLENMPNSKVTTIDTWKGGKDHSPENPEINFSRIKEHFDFNTAMFRDRVEAIQSNSFDGLISLYKRQEKFDFVYVDGSHTAMDVNTDLILSFKLLNVNSIIYCDDYYWGFNDASQYDSPKLGIDSFVNVYANKLVPMVGLANNAIAFIKVAE